MQLFQGKAVSGGIAMGPVVIWEKNNYIAECRQIQDTDTELVRLAEALELSKAQLSGMQEKVRSEEADLASSAENYKTRNAILETHLMLLEDEGFMGQVRKRIQTEQVNAEYAVRQVSREIAEMFTGMEDVYLRERAADICDIARRMLQNLSGQESVAPVLAEPSIIVAEDLSPSETLQFDREKVLAFVTNCGSYYSHAAILARAMGIPALVGVDMGALSELCKESGLASIVDAEKGRMILSPDDKTIEEYTLKIKQEQQQKGLLQEYKTQESVTKDGRKVHICANVGRVAEVQDALDNGADGIGLFRSEFLYLDKETFPTEEEQFEEYKRAVVIMGQKQVIIRTLDIGADKQAEYFGMEQEPNPALGCRGIRVCLRYPEIFKTQLRALFRAAVHGNLAVMYPTITSMEEVEQIQALAEQVEAELEEQKIPYKIPAQGIMIETPAAVMISDDLAKAVDFVSIGTNDLAQYTLAIDRQNNALDEFYNPHHKAILRMIRMVVENVHKAGKKVGICGELAADITLTKEFISMGVDELSVVPGKVLELRKMVREMKGE